MAACALTRVFMLGFGGLAVAMGAFVATWLTRARPWERTVPFRPDPQAEAADAEIVREGLDRLPAISGEGPDIVLIVLDTVRADHLELYGYPHPTMPRLTAWARDARIHDAAVSTSSWTLPAHASLFTGLLPLEHGARGRTVEGTAAERALARPRRQVLERPLSARATTLAERLQDQGYATLGVAANLAFLDEGWGLDQGFDLWVCGQVGPGRAGLPYTRADRVTAMALAAVDGALPDLSDPAGGGRAPIFLFVNYMEGHAPYIPREGFVRDPSALTWLWRAGARRERLAREVLAGRADLPDGVRRAWIEAYDAGLRFLDQQLGRLLDGLSARGIGSDAQIVILSDHGEYFGEHRLIEHSKDIYETGLRIALIERGPGVAPGRSAAPVSIAEVPGWLMERAGKGTFPRSMGPGEACVAELYGSRGRDLFNAAYGDRFNRVRRSFRIGDRKLILGSDGSIEAYDLALDPGEERDLRAEPWARQMAREAQAWLAARGVDDAPEGGGEEPAWADVEALRALGYVE